MLQVLALTSVGVVAVAAFDSWLWHSLLAAEQRQGKGTTIRFILFVGAALLALAFIGSIARGAVVMFFAET
jgi:hypothetical protein